MPAQLLYNKISNQCILSTFALRFKKFVTLLKLDYSVVENNKNFQWLRGTNQCLDYEKSLVSLATHTAQPIQVRLIPDCKDSFYIAQLNNFTSFLFWFWYFGVLAFFHFLHIFLHYCIFRHFWHFSIKF